MPESQNVAQDPEQENVRECRRVKPGTLGYQMCWRPQGHDGLHRCQGHPMHGDWADVEIRRQP